MSSEELLFDSVIALLSNGTAYGEVHIRLMFFLFCAFLVFHETVFFCDGIVPPI